MRAIAVLTGATTGGRAHRSRRRCHLPHARRVHGGDPAPACTAAAGCLAVVTGKHVGGLLDRGTHLRRDRLRRPWLESCASASSLAFDVAHAAGAAGRAASASVPRPASAAAASTSPRWARHHGADVTASCQVASTPARSTRRLAAEAASVSSFSQTGQSQAARVASRIRREARKPPAPSRAAAPCPQLGAQEDATTDAVAVAGGVGDHRRSDVPTAEPTAPPRSVRDRHDRWCADRAAIRGTGARPWPRDCTSGSRARSGPRPAPRRPSTARGAAFARQVTVRAP